MVGALIGMGVPEIEAKRYENKLKTGNYLIAVHAHDGDEKDRNIVDVEGACRRRGLSSTTVSLIRNAPRLDARGIFVRGEKPNPLGCKTIRRMRRVFLMKKTYSLAFLFLSLFMLISGCNRSALTGSKLTLANYDKVTNGMTKAQVERIMGAPTSMESKDMLIFKRTTYRYEEGSKFAMFTFKNDELDSKDGNLAAQ